MGVCKTRTCAKCGAEDTSVTHYDKWKAGYPGQDPQYEYFSDYPRKVLGEHLRVVCRECQYEWTEPTKDSAAQREAAGKKGKKK